MGLFNAPRQYPRYLEQYGEELGYFGDRDAWLEQVKDVPEKAVNLFAVHCLHWEVHNGGFCQYFFNSAGSSAPEAARGFAAIGMPEVSKVVVEAMSLLGEPFPGSIETRRDILGDDEDRFDFDGLDKRFYDLADTERFFFRIPKFVPFADRYAAQS